MYVQPYNIISYMYIFISRQGMNKADIKRVKYGLNIIFVLHLWYLFGPIIVYANDCVDTSPA